MGNIAELILRTHPEEPIPAEIVQQAETWAKKGLDISKAARKEAAKCGTTEPTCDVAYAVLLFNFAVIREVSFHLNWTLGVLTSLCPAVRQEGGSEATVGRKFALDQSDRSGGRDRTC